MIASSRRLAKAFPRHESKNRFVSSSRMIGISFCGVFGCRTRSIGDRSMSSSPIGTSKNCWSPLCLFNAVDADRVSIIHA